MFTLFEELIGVLVGAAALWCCVYLLHSVLHGLASLCRRTRELPRTSPQYNQRTNPAPGWKSDKNGRRIRPQHSI